ncbi:hypothetical protein CICLE_v10010104mg [Citrus x clementina]|uniref:Uncharacterized protein n=1 Tax=Citrus clementina TaxID=85681 RepID=V4UQW8_CITCL|nr:hypothetical protein CICLE_v10010104mg [Citrus x clementina]
MISSKFLIVELQNNRIINKQNSIFAPRDEKNLKKLIDKVLVVVNICFKLILFELPRKRIDWFLRSKSKLNH